MTDGRVRDLFPEERARGDLVDLVDDVLRWRMTEQRWSLVRDALAQVGTALDAHDRDGFQRAMVAVELFYPPRATRIGEEPTVPAPEAVRELTTELVHRAEVAPEPPDTLPPPPR